MDKLMGNEMLKEAPISIFARLSDGQLECVRRLACGLLWSRETEMLVTGLADGLNNLFVQNISEADTVFDLDAHDKGVELDFS